MKVVFFGTPDFAAETLQYLLKNSVNVLGVVTQPDRPKGRSGHPTPCPVKQYLLSNSLNIPLFQSEKASSPEVAEQLAALNADLFVVVAFGEIIKQNLLEMPKVACINVHGSILPKYRGAAPIQRSIMEGESETGITIMHMAQKLDSGDIIKIVKTAIGEEVTYGELEEKLCQLGSKALYEVICDLEKGIIERKPQDHQKASYAKKIETKDCKVVWGRNAKELHNLIRGVTPRPGAWCNILLRGKQKRLKITKARFSEQAGKEPGEIVSFNNDAFIIACAENSLQILELQLEGKKAMKASEFIRGFSQNTLSF
jgi:methionyl-tRNA formyltransferase